MKTNLLVLMLFPPMLTGCAAVSSKNGSNSKVCNSISSVTTINPASAAADHAAGTPGNQVQFTATTVTTYPKDCAIPAVIVAPYQTQWASSTRSMRRSTAHPVRARMGLRFARTRPFLR